MVSILQMQDMAARTCLPTLPVCTAISCGKYLAFSSKSNRMLAGIRIEIQQIVLHPIRRSQGKIQQKDINPSRCAKVEQMQRISRRTAMVAKVKAIIKQSLMLLGLNFAKAWSRLLSCPIVVTESGITFETFNGKC